MFGTNPLAFAWPRPGNEPFVFDFATSAIALGDIELHARQGKPIPDGWALDSDGQPTNASAALAGAMQTFGGHKGSALAAMIELLAGALIGDMTSLESMAFDAGAGATPCHGAFAGLRPQGLPGGRCRSRDAAGGPLFAAITEQGARLPSQRRFSARKRSQTHGVWVNRQVVEDVRQLL